jgi:hypothetical protein
MDFIISPPELSSPMEKWIAFREGLLKALAEYPGNQCLLSALKDADEDIAWKKKVEAEEASREPPSA